MDRTLSKAVQAGAAELALNPRARSAVLRVAERLAAQGADDPTDAGGEGG